MQIAKAKEKWMRDHVGGTNDAPAETDLAGPDGYIRDFPRCPSGGTYTIGKISEPTACSIAEHRLHFRMRMASSAASTTNTNR